ncbi:MAG: myb dna binding [Lasallia pustulata]|uniref:Myb dna binding n=1 Tax=Lasallia pustulata TaxID=136370 RepID=A0A5M8PCV2_9LECA|nr:MAG: myb dna binding [Lasallia pustulata]
MVTTRGKHFGAAPESLVAETSPSLDGPAALRAADASSQEAIIDGDAGTIGSRLRKRRRTCTPPTDGTPTASKRPNLRQTLSPENKRAHAEAPSRETPSASKPLTNGKHKASPEAARAVATPEPAPQPQPPQQEQEPQQPQHQSQYSPPATSAAPDLHAVITKIIDHGETVERHYANQAYDEMEMVDTESWLSIGASLHLKVQSLPILDNLANQILNTLAKSTYQDILTIVTEPESEPGQAYATLKSLFDHTKKVYSIHEPFLSPYLLGLIEQGQIDTIRKANLATFVSSVFGSRDVGFYHLNEYFLDTFVADGNRLLKSQAQLFLDLKTQAYISAMSNGERPRDEILEDLFPSDLEEPLLSRRPGAKSLAPSEADFLQRARNRSKGLLEEPDTEDAIAALPEKYVWEDFLRDVSSYVSKNFDTIVGVPARKPIRSRPSNFSGADQHGQNHQQNGVQPSTEIAVHDTAQVNDDPDDIVAKAARAAHLALQDFGNSQQQSAPQQQQPQQVQPPQQLSEQQLQQQQQLQHQQQIHYYYQQQQQAQPYQGPYQGPYNGQANGNSDMGQQQQQAQMDQNGVPFPTQSAPTRILYERARMAATAKSSPSNRRAGLPSQRRPWTTEEENALMAGLDRVKGPHWSQILAMFGPGGTIDESLKDRNQVQLKDKARNLKLFFLKSGIEVPYYLQFVTGELKTRAPAQAAKNEARERQKQSPGATPTTVNGAEREVSAAVAPIDEQHQHLPTEQQQPQDDQAQVQAKAENSNKAPDPTPATAHGMDEHEAKLSRSLQDDTHEKAIEAGQAAAIAAAVAAAQS